jgi:hypothetical protein
MVREQLEASSGQVRCGHCMAVFDASAPSPEVQPEHATKPESEPILSFVQQAQKRAFWSKKNVRLSLGLLSLFLVILLALQIIRTERERVLQVAPTLQPLVQNLCLFWSCPPILKMQIDGWRIESSSFQKEGVNAFRLTIQLKNISLTNLLIPQLELSLLDTNDGILLRRIMKISTEQSLPKEAERTYHFLITPQPHLTNSIVGYRLVLFYP